MSERTSGDTVPEDDIWGEAEAFNTVKDTVEHSEDDIQELIDYYGPQKFHYGTYLGTIEDAIAGGCPAIQGALVEGGAGAVKRLVEGHTITEEEYQRAIDPDKQDDEKKSNEKSEEQLNSDAEEKEKPAKGETVSDKSTVKEDVREVIDETKGNIEANHTPVAVEEIAQDSKEVIVDLKADTNDDTLAPLPDSDVAEPEHVVKIEEVGSADPIVPVEVKSDAKTEVKVESQPETSDAIPIELFQPERIVAPVIVVEQNDSVPAEKAKDVRQEELVELMNETAGETEATQPLPILDKEYVVEESPFNAYIDPPEYVSRGSANELAEQPTVTDAFQIPNEHLLEEEPELIAEQQNSVVEVIDVLDESEAEILAPDEEPALNHSVIEEVDQPVTDEASILQQAIEHEQADTEEFEPDAAIEAVIDIIAKLEGEEPEYEAEVNAVEGGRYIKKVALAVSHLETARTREECQLYLAELRKSLSELFEALGYENAEAMAIRWITLVRQYGTETLKELIATLLQTLAQQNATHFAKTTGHAHKHHWFGQRVVERVVQAIPIVQVA